MIKLLNVLKGFYPKRRSGCSEKDALIKVFLEDTKIEEKFRLLDHIFTCPSCSSVFNEVREVWAKENGILNKLERIDLSEENIEILKRFSKQEIKKLKSQAGWKKSVFFKPRSIPVAAAGIIIVIVFSVFLLLKDNREIEIERKVGQLEIQLIDPKGDIHNSFLVFCWTPIKEADSYTLEIFDRELGMFYRTYKIKSESFVLPEEIFEQLKKGMTYFWKVTAVMENNQGIESKFTKFKINPE
jgi:hypothetical protein